MKRGILTPPDAFSIAPLLSLLPITGSISKLESYSSALFARFDQVSSLREGAKGAGETDLELRYGVEEAMLRQVLDWLANKTE